MSFGLLIIRNLFRQRARTALTVIGISLGIMTVVALGVITGGLGIMATELSRAGGADFIVGQKGSADFSFSTVSEEDLQTLKDRADVQQAIGVLLLIKRVESNPFFAMLGVDPRDLPQLDTEILDGRRIAPGTKDEIMLGDAASKDLQLAVGDHMVVEGREFTIVGTYRSGILFQDKGAILPLELVQDMSGRAGVVTFVMVNVGKGHDVSAVASSIEEAQPNVVTVSNASDFGELDQGLELMDAANVAISFLAVGIGAIGVMNTMSMAVFERTREFGIFRAVGWSGARILKMIVNESLLLCAVATVIGFGLGVLASEAVVHLTSVGGLIEPSYAPSVFLKALVVAVGVAIVGAAYPSWRAVRLTPMEALRHE
jgi:putative ABC transport system permease protein